MLEHGLDGPTKVFLQKNDMGGGEGRYNFCISNPKYLGGHRPPVPPSSSYTYARDKAKVRDKAG